MPKQWICGLAALCVWFTLGTPAALSGETDNSGAILPLVLMKEDSPEPSKDEEKAAILKALREKLRSLSSGNDPELNEDLLTTLRHGHPRLLITDERIQSVRHLIKSDETEKRYLSNLTRKAEGMLKEPTPQRHIVGSDALLEESRSVLKRVTTLAGLYRLTKDPRYLKRAREDMLAVATFPDWSPKHFLDVAEMTAAMGIGYDWLYKDLSAQDRKTIEDAIVRLGLDAGLEQYSTCAWWTRADENWNLVCNGGLTVGALAVANEEHEKANRMLHLVKASVPIPMQTFAPDGGWPEGPGYWNYATKYCMFMMGSMQTALGTDFNFSKFPGFDQTGLFNIYCYGPIDKCFNFADCADELRKAPQMFWMSTLFDKPVYAGGELNAAEKLTDIFHVLYFPSKFETQEQAKLPLSKLFEGVDVATMRTSWTDPNAVFVGIKGGNNAAPHAHLDLGSFVIDAYGCRWALDLGPDDYDLPGYFGKERWNYYRLRTEGHNTLTVGKDNQDSKAKAKLFVCCGTPFTRASVDMSAADGNDLPNYRRIVTILNGQEIDVSDMWHPVKALDAGREPGAPDGSLNNSGPELLPNPIEEVVWHFHTSAITQLTNDGRSVLLKQPDSAGRWHEMYLHLVAPPKNLKFEIQSSSAPTPQAQQLDVSDITVHLPLSHNNKLIGLYVRLSSSSSSPSLNIGKFE